MHPPVARQSLTRIASLGFALLCLLPASCSPQRAPQRAGRPVPERFARTPAPLESFHLPPAEVTDARGRVPAVARLELNLPERATFVLHGTIPLPKEVSLGPIPPALAVISRGEGNALVPAQVEVVSRYPTGEPDVVEVIARVERHPRDRPGRLIAFDVVLGQPDPLAGSPSSSKARSTRLELPSVVEDFFRQGDARHVLLRARDAYGQLYAAELSGEPEAAGFGSSHVLADGAWLRRTRTYATMVPIEEQPPEADSSTPASPPSPRGVGNGGPTLPHLFGVHAYWTECAGDTRIGLDLRINNGACSGSRAPDALEQTLGITYFDSFELVLPSGWHGRPLVSDPFLGEAYLEQGLVVIPLVRPYPGPSDGEEGAEDGKPAGRKADPKKKGEKESQRKKPGPLHVMGPEAQMHRRWTLSPNDDERGHLALEGLAFSIEGRGLWSWYEPTTARFLTHRGLLCEWDDFARGALRGKAGLASELESGTEKLRRLIQTGAANGVDIIGRAMGWAHPWFVKVQGGTGGGGIQIYEGHMAAAASSGPGVEALMLYHRMNVSRQPQAMFDRFGDFVGMREWLDESGVVPFDFRTNGGMLAPQFRLPCNGGPPATNQLRFAYKQGRRPPYDQGTPADADGQVTMRDDNLWAWSPHDGQHMIRYTKFPKALVWLANDALAKDDLMVSGETFHLQFHEADHRPVSWSPGVSLRVYERQVEEHPGLGANIGRDHAWGIDAMVAAYSIAPLEWRERHRDWFLRVGRFLVKAALPSGIIMRNPNPKILGHDKYEAAQSYQSLFLLHAMRGMNEAVLRDVSPGVVKSLENLTLRTLEYLYWGPVYERIPLKEQYQPKQGPSLTRGGPREAFAVALNDNGRTPPFCDAERWGPGYIPEDGFAGGVEFFHCWSALEYGYLITDGQRGSGLENRYLRRLLACWTQPRNHDALLDELFEQTLRPSSDNSGNWAGLAGRLQALRRH